jgi:nucleoside-diphosphate-sugar epimerase
MTRKVFITGAGGFIGRHLVNRLISEGDSVHVLWRSSSKRTVPDSWRTSVTVHVWDESAKHLIEIMAGAHPDLVVHLASLFIAEHSSAQVDALVQSNVLFGAQLLEAMAVSGVKRFLNFGTSWQHFQDEPYNPVCLYAATKQAFEAVIRFYVEGRDFRSITLKLFDTYGPGDDRGKLFSTLMRLLGTQESIALSPGEQVVDFAHVDDVVDATLVAAHRLLCEDGGKEESFGISGGHPLPLRELVALVGAIAGKPLNVQWGGRPYRAREVMAPWTEYPRLPGWNPRISLEDGIRRMVSSNV